MPRTVSATVSGESPRQSPGYARNLGNLLRRFEREHQPKWNTSSATYWRGSRLLQTKLASTLPMSSIGTEKVALSVQPCPARAETSFLDQKFCNLNCVEGSTFSKVVVRNEQRQTSITINRRITAHPTHVTRIAPRCFKGCGNIPQFNSGSR